MHAEEIIGVVESAQGDPFKTSLAAADSIKALLQEHLLTTRFLPDANSADEFIRDSVRTHLKENVDHEHPNAIDCMRALLQTIYDMHPANHIMQQSLLQSAMNTVNARLARMS